MREIRSYGSVRGVAGNRHPYRDSPGRVGRGRDEQRARLGGPRRRWNRLLLPGRRRDESPNS
jgi:hypothetical protein